MELGIVGIELDGLVKPGDCLVELAQRHEGDAEFIMQSAAVRLEFESPAYVRHRLVMMAKHLMNPAEIRPERGIVGLRFEGLTVQPRGLLECTEPVESGRQGRNISNRDHEHHPDAERV